MFCCDPHCETITGFQGCTVAFAVVAQMVGGTALHARRLRVQLQMGSMGFLIHIIHPAAA